MTNEQLQQANKINADITLIDELDVEVARFKKERFSGSLPTAVLRVIAKDSAVAMKVVEMVQGLASEKRELLQQQLASL